jgi:phosphoglycolate phosphatase-like HAD superfamily hydrolase
MKRSYPYASLRALVVTAVIVLSACAQPPTGAAHASDAAVKDPLPSWNDGATRTAIMGFVTAVTTNGTTDFVPVPERIAVFDNDGTLWSEQPMYFQFLFVVDRIRALAGGHPEWKTKEPFRSALAGDTKGLAASGEKGLLELLAVTHAGMTTDEFADTVRAWIATARHPVSKWPYTEMTYQPMRELLDYFRANGFKTFIVSGGGTEFMRPWVEQVYGIPPEQVVGSRGKLKYEVKDGKPALVKLAEMELVDDGPGKPVGIAQMIGRRPIAAFGNSDGDFEMLEYTSTGPGRRLAVIVHHTDANREWAYDRGSPVGKLERGLDEAAARGWILADMKRDWKTIYPSIATTTR